MSAKENVNVASMDMAIENANLKTGLEKFRAYSKLMGPAWLAIALNIGGATVANAGSVASRTGFTYLWTLVPQVFVIWMVCILFVKITMKTQLGPIGTVRKHIGEGAAWITGISIFIVNTVFHAIQYALIGNIMNTLFGVSEKTGVIIGFLFVMFIVFNPAKGDKSVKIIQQVLQWMVWILLASFIAILFVVDIDWAGALRGFIPSFQGTPGELVTLSGLMGSVIAINVPSMAAYGARQNKWGPNRDSLNIFSQSYTNTLLILVQAAVIIAIGSVLYPQGVLVTGAGTLAQTFEPIAGRASTVLLSVGLAGAVLSTMVSQCLISGYVITDLFKWDPDLTTRRFKISEFVVTLFGLSAPLLGWNAFAISTYGAGFNLTFFPIVSVLLLIIANKKEVMGELAVSPKFNVASIVAILLSLLATGNYWYNIFA